MCFDQPYHTEKYRMVKYINEYCGYKQVPTIMFDVTWSLRDSPQSVWST